MATQKQIEVNRRNSKKSCGPKTIAGKAAVRLNSLVHGLRARTVGLPSENREEFDLQSPIPWLLAPGQAPTRR